MNTITGRCLCGGVTFEAQAEALETHACHCSECRRWSGAPAMGIGVASVNFSGEQNIARYESSKWALRGFCSGRVWPRRRGPRDLGSGRRAWFRRRRSRRGRRTVLRLGGPDHPLPRPGPRSAVVLVHGLLATAEMWQSVIAGLSESEAPFRVIALDARGHGGSAKPHQAGAYGAEMAADVVRLLDHLGVSAAHLVGYSMGAEIALYIATHHPDRVASLVMGGSGWSGSAEADVYESLGNALRSEGSMRSVMAARSPQGEDTPDFEATVASVHQMLTNQDVQAIAGVALGMRPLVDLPATALEAVDVPVLGISGETDPERPNLEKMVGVVPDFTMEVLAGRDHMSAVEDPGFVRLIVDFLAARRTAADPFLSARLRLERGLHRGHALRRGVFRRPGAVGRRGVVLDGELQYLGAFVSQDLPGEEQRHVDPGRHAGRGDDLALAYPALRQVGGAHLLERVFGAPVRRGVQAPQDAGGAEDQ